MQNRDGKKSCVRNNHHFTLTPLQQYSPGSSVQHGEGFFAVCQVLSAAAEGIEDWMEIFTSCLFLPAFNGNILPLCKCHCALHL